MITLDGGQLDPELTRRDINLAILPACLRIGFPGTADQPAGQRQYLNERATSSHNLTLPVIPLEDKGVLAGNLACRRNRSPALANGAAKP